jgi:ubiquinone/menaquinone biosynthesis C-methylase UbiE
MTRYTLSQIRDFWTRQAKEHGRSHAASWSDQPVIDLEVAEITAHLSEGDRVLDIGCANGYSTVQFAAQKPITIRGLDYIPEMIQQAKARLAQLPGELSGKVEFDVGDITGLEEPSDTYDKVIVVRVIINLRTWPRQLKAMQQCARVLKRGGLLLMSEATLQGWNRLNAFRREWGLPDIPMPPFNQYLDQDQVAEALRPELDLVDIVNFASTYFVGSRVFKPLLAKAIQAPANIADPHMEWNRFFAQLPQAGDYGTQKLFIFRKK